MKSNYTDEEIREAYRDVKLERDIARTLGLRSIERQELVKMVALARWQRDRREHPAKPRKQRKSA